MDDRIAVSPAECSRLLMQSRTKIYEMLATGELPSFRWGRSRRIPVEALRRLVNEMAATDANDRGREEETDVRRPRSR